LTRPAATRAADALRQRMPAAGGASGEARRVIGCRVLDDSAFNACHSCARADRAGRPTPALRAK